jgi:hypothetical protein
MQPVLVHLKQVLVLAKQASMQGKQDLVQDLQDKLVLALDKLVLVLDKQQDLGLDKQDLIQVDSKLDLFKLLELKVKACHQHFHHLPQLEGL